MIAALACIIPSFRLFCQRKLRSGRSSDPALRPMYRDVFPCSLLENLGYSSALARRFSRFLPSLWPPVMPGAFSYLHRHAQEGRSLRTVPLAYRKDIERYREKRDISFPSCAAASSRRPERTPAYRSPTASADSHRRWRGYRVWWASPAAGACRAPREW